jgi:DNA polymerase-3 subunit alpha
MPEFIHLHVHSEYSLLDGAIRIKDLCQKAKDLGMPAVAVTDHGNMHGAVTFYQTAMDMGIKPIIGCEVYVAPGDVDEEFAHRKKTERYHLVLLAKNQVGYKNLIKLVSLGHLEGFHYKPRVSKYLLNKYSEGLICLSACLGGEVPAKLSTEGLDAGIRVNGIERQKSVNKMLKQVAEATGLPLVATNDCHYLNHGDDEAHDILLCIQTGKTVDTPGRMRMDTDQLYFKSQEEMEADFADVPEAIANTQKIAERCNVEIELGNYSFPVYELPEGMTIDAEFERMSREGLRKRIENITYEIDETPTGNGSTTRSASSRRWASRRISSSSRTSSTGPRTTRFPWAPGAARPPGPSWPGRCASPTSTPSPTTCSSSASSTWSASPCRISTWTSASAAAWRWSSTARRSTATTTWPRSPPSAP